MSVLISRSQKCRNNEKSYMIAKLFHDLDHAIKESLDNEVCGDVSIYMGGIRRDQDFLSKANSLPCINTECEFLKYLKIFYPKIDFFPLPASNENFHCIVCDMIGKGILKRSEIQILNNFKIRLTK